MQKFAAQRDKLQKKKSGGEKSAIIFAVSGQGGKDRFPDKALAFIVGNLSTSVHSTHHANQLLNTFTRFMYSIHIPV